MVAPSQILSDCVYTWERTVMGISVHTAETEMAKTPYYIYLLSRNSYNLAGSTLAVA